MPVDVAPLVADGGQIRLVRRVAAYVFGGRDVTLPEDVDNPVDFLPDRREFGWVAQLAGPRPGLSGRRFVRADATIDAVEGVSNTEQLLDDAAERAGGDVHFETVIRGRGLAGQEPGVDFRLGDRLAARFWQRLLPGQLVTEVGWDEQGPYAKFGGQMIRDLDALDRTRTELIRTIKKEREESADEVKAYADRRATTAESNAKTYATGQASAAEGRAKSYAKEYADSQDSKQAEVMNQNIIGLNAQIAALDDETSRKRVEAMAALNQAIRDLDSEVNRKRNEDIAALNQQIKDLDGQVAQDRTKAMAELNRKITDLGGDVARDRAAAMAELNQKITDLGGDVERERTKAINQLNQKITSMSSEADRKRTADMSSLNTKITGLNNDLTALKQQEINDLQSKWNRQQEVLNQQDIDFRKMQTQINTAQGDINKANSNFRTLQGQINAAQQDVNTANDNFRKMQTQINTAQGDINKANSNFRKLQTQINDEQTGINAVNEKFRRLQADFNDEQQKVNNQNTEFRKLQTQINDEQTGINALNTRLQKEAGVRASEIDRRAMRMVWVRDDNPVKYTDWGWVQIGGNDMTLYSNNESGVVAYIWKTKLNSAMGVYSQRCVAGHKCVFSSFATVQECLFLFVPD